MVKKEKFTEHQKLMNSKYKKMGREDIFTSIYANNIWGGQHGEFCSGPGSHVKRYVIPYVELVNSIINENNIGVVVDIGCGDFYIGKKIQADRYIGCDIVKPLIEHNRRLYGNNNIEFLHLDAVKDELPDGELCLIREVLQHLSNNNIKQILKKTKKYKYVLVTESVTKESLVSRYNINKHDNEHTRMVVDSGLYLEHSPFNMRGKVVQEINKLNDKRIIRSFLMIND